MQLIDHVSITVRALDAAKPFYAAVMSALGACVAYDRADAIGFGERNRPHDDRHTYVSIFQSADAAPDRRRHVCFRAASRTEVDAFFNAGLSAGGTSDGAPGVRSYHPAYYAAFILDPEGNRLEAVFHQPLGGSP